MAKLEPKKIGLVLGLFIALIHLVWSILILITPKGMQWFIDWVLGLHRMQMPVTILPFHLVSAVLLVILTFVIGYIFGYVFAAIWNWKLK